LHCCLSIVHIGSRIVTMTKLNTQAEAYLPVALCAACMLVNISFSGCSDRWYLADPLALPDNRVSSVICSLERLARSNPVECHRASELLLSRTTAAPKTRAWCLCYLLSVDVPVHRTLGSLATTSWFRASWLDEEKARISHCTVPESDSTIRGLVIATLVIPEVSRSCCMVQLHLADCTRGQFGNIVQELRTKATVAKDLDVVVLRVWCGGDCYP
jgi:hypothetical protein